MSESPVLHAATRTRRFFERFGSKPGTAPVVEEKSLDYDPLLKISISGTRRDLAELRYLVLVETNCGKPPGLIGTSHKDIYCVERTYKHFEALHKYASCSVVGKRGAVLFPALPLNPVSKRYFQTLDKERLDRCCASLEGFLLKVVANKELLQSDHCKHFLLPSETFKRKKQFV